MICRALASFDAVPEEVFSTHTTTATEAAFDEELWPVELTGRRATRARNLLKSAEGIHLPMLFFGFRAEDHITYLNLILIDTNST